MKLFNLSYLLFTLGGIFIGASIQGGTWLLLSLVGAAAIVFGFVWAADSKAPEPPPAIITRNPTQRITTVTTAATILRPQPQGTGTQTAIKFFDAPDPENEPLGQLRMDQVWASTDATLFKTVRAELTALTKLIPKVHTAAFLMYVEIDNIYLLRTAAGNGADKLEKNAHIEVGNGLLSGFFKPEITRILEGDLAGSQSLQIYKDKVPVKSLIAVPIFDGNRRQGILMLDSLQPNAFGPELLDSLALVAQTLQMLCFKSFMSAKNHIEQQQYSVLYTYQKRFFESMSVKDIFQQVGQYVRDYIHYDRMMLLAMDAHDESHGKVILCDGVDADFFTNYEFTLSDKGLFPMAIQKNRPVERFFNQSEYVIRINENERRNMDLHYMFMLPAAINPTDSTVANFAINLETYNAKHYSEHEKSLLKAITGTACFALERVLQVEKDRNLATRDGLTGLINHRTMHERLRTEKLRAERQKINIGVLMMDIDHFKSVNDTYGHPAGDEIIKGIARTICSEVRTEIDVVARYGGEEFVVGLIDCTPEGLVDTAERIRKAVERTPFDIKQAQPLSVTVSIGAYLVVPEDREMKRAIDFADKALYKSKTGGRNRVTEYKDMDEVEAAEPSATIATEAVITSPASISNETFTAPAAPISNEVTGNTEQVAIAITRHRDV